MESFDGGINNKYEPHIIEDNESPDCKNVVFDDLGSVQTREGYSQLNTAPLYGTKPIDGLFTTHFNNNSSTMVVWSDGLMYTLDGTSTFTTVPSAQSVFTGSTRVNFAMYQDILFMGNGNSTYKYNGTYFTQHAIPAPTTSPTAAADSAAGVLSGTFKYKAAYVNSYVVVGDLGPASTTFTVSLTKGYLTSIPVAATSMGVNSRYLYRTRDLDITATVSSTFYYLDELSNNTATTYVDNKSDSELGAAGPTDQGAPPKYKIIITFQERLFAVDDIDPQFLYYSELGEPFTWPSTNFIKISDGDGEKITGLGIQGNSLIVYKENSVYLIYMADTDPSNWQRVKSNSKYGCASHNSIVDFENLQLFLGQQARKITGFYAFTGLAIDQDATQLTVGNMYSDAKSDRMEPELEDFQNAYKQNCVAIIYKDKIYISITKGTGQTTNNYIYQFDFIRRGKSRQLGSWVPFTGISANAFTIYDGKLYFGDSTSTGRIYQLENGTYSDNGAAINSYFWTKEFEGMPSLQDYEKDFRYANFVLETLGDWLMTVTYKLDSDKGGGNTKDVDLNPGGSLWGSMIWGTNIWGGGVVRANVKIELGQSVGKKIQFKFDNKNTVGLGFKVLRGNFYYNLRGLR